MQASTPDCLHGKKRKRVNERGMPLHAIHGYLTYSRIYPSQCGRAVIFDALLIMLAVPQAQAGRSLSDGRSSRGDLGDACTLNMCTSGALRDGWTRTQVPEQLSNHVCHGFLSWLNNCLTMSVMVFSLGSFQPSRQSILSRLPSLAE